MGLYPNRGIEYRHYTNPVNYKILIPLEQLDDRLVNSPYYIRQRESWFENLGHQPRFVTLNELQFTLTPQEREIISNCENTSESNFKSGFYDVMYVWSTL